MVIYYRNKDVAREMPLATATQIDEAVSNMTAESQLLTDLATHHARPRIEKVSQQRAIERAERERAREKERVRERERGAE